MEILSLFDGISCGRVALDRAGIEVDRYVAYETDDKYAIKISKKNYSDIEHMGDVFKGDYTQYKDFDLLIGGSPCSWWSNARQNKEGFENKPDGIGYKLFLQYVRALKEAKPKYFLYENNWSIDKSIQEQITKDLGVKPIMIDSRLVSAQSRKRLYWTNIPNVEQPKDKGILIPDVIKDGVTGVAFRNQKRKQGVIPFVNIRKDQKSNCLLTYMTTRNCCVQLKNGTIRPLTADEFEVLQTLPKGYTDCICESKRKEVIGLGWTVDVIAHILSNMEVEKSIEVAS